MHLMMSFATQVSSWLLKEKEAGHGTGCKGPSKERSLVRDAYNIIRVKCGLSVTKQINL